MISIGGNHSHEAPSAFCRELVRRGVKNLTVVPSNAAGYQLDVLIGGGCVKTLVHSYWRAGTTSERLPVPQDRPKAEA